MPPKNATANASRRKGPQFNPPRPVKGAPQTSTAAPTRPAGATEKASTSAAQPVATIISSSEDEQEDEQDADDSDDLMEDAPTRDNARPATSSAPMAPPIPAPLLARLLYENFEDPNTQIQKGAMNLVGKYMEIFVREAFARAQHERENAVKRGGISDGFLQVEDLEKLAPQLVLDF
ncbi:Nn.00g008100.m01.CDS01 [Neocucurbitaria sp. VM-36]